MAGHEIDDSLQAIVKDCRTALADHYGEKLLKILLFGSSARGEGTPDSDIDLLVVLDGRLDNFAELEILSEVLYPVQLRSDRLISAKPSDVYRLEHGATQLHRNVQQEAVAV
jgi:uncharacterized protein